MPTARARRLVFAGLYFCEGAPIGFLWWALPTILRERGLALERIGALTSWLVLPWALKFLWAPLLDAHGGRALRAWIVAAQLVMAATLLPLVALDPRAGLGWITATLVLHAFAAASQDAAIDALALRTTPLEERGRLNGWMQLGMLLGRALLGGGALVARARIGDAGVVWLLVGGLGVSALVVLRSGVLRLRSDPVTPARPVLGTLAAALRRRATWIGLAFAATSGAAFETVGALAGPLLVDHGLDAPEVGRFLGIAAVGAMALGALLGGQASDRFGLRRVVGGTGLALGLEGLALAALVSTTPRPEALLALLTAVYLGIGAFTAASYALFMALTDPALGATQFSAYMGATNACESWSARLGGTLATRSGYAAGFAVPSVIALAALPLLALLEARPQRASGGTPRP